MDGKPGRRTGPVLKTVRAIAWGSSPLPSVSNMIEIEITASDDCHKALGYNNWASIIKGLADSMAKEIDDEILRSLDD